MTDPERLTREALRQLGRPTVSREKHGNAYHDVIPSQQNGTSGQRRLLRQQEAARQRKLDAAQSARGDENDCTT